MTKGHGSTFLQSAKANQKLEDGLLERLDNARIMRDLCWLDFYSNLELETINPTRLRHKMELWEQADTEVVRLEAKAGLYTEHHTWCANFDRLQTAGYKE